MPRTARLLVPDLPHHVTQRGNRREDVFFGDRDRERYLELLRDSSQARGLEVLGWCLMTNHVHLVVVPPDSDALALVLRTVHMRYAQWVNRGHGWTGHLWQGRFYSTPLDEAHCWAAMRYIEQNPLRAGLAAVAEDYPWSSAAAHCGLRDDPLASGRWRELLDGADWRQELHEPIHDEQVQRLRRHTYAGAPCGDESFVARLSAQVGRDLALRPRGRPRKG